MEALRYEQDGDVALIALDDGKDALSPERLSALHGRSTGPRSRPGR
jgi:hypothetical protein